MSGRPNGINSEMNRVPEDNSPLLRYNPEFRDMPQQDTRKGFPKCCSKCCFVFLLVTVIVCALVAIPVGVSQKSIDKGVKQFVASKTAMLKGSETVKQWSSPQVPVHFTIHMFNLTNKDEFMKGEKPKIKEVGPFVYKENKVKFDLTWNEEQTILRYNESCNYTLDRNSSYGDPREVNITTINLPLMGLLVQFEKLQALANSLNSKLLQTLLKDVIAGFDEALRNEFKENLFITKSVDEIVWGYTDPFLKFLSSFNLSVAAIPKDGKFQLEERSGFTGPNMVYTGRYNSKDTARFLMYNGQTGMEGWGTPYANMINGTEALLFHPGVDSNDRLDLFVSELFRSGYFSYYQEVEEYGVKMYQYRLPKELLSNKTTDPGFNMNGPDGVLNLTAVYPLNVPVFVSKPHFLDADPVYLSYLDGPKPNRSIHDAFLNVEPITGAVLHAAKRLQINIELKKNTNITELKNLQTLTFLPLIWVDEGATMNSTQADQFKHTVYLPLHSIDTTALALASATGFFGVLSCLLLLVLSVYFCEKAIKNRRQDPLSVHFDD